MLVSPNSLLKVIIVMQAISSPNDDESLMGNVVGDIQQIGRASCRERV